MIPNDQLTPMPHDPNIERIRLDDPLYCDGCGELLFPGDPAYAHRLLFVTGCSRPCCRDAAKMKTAHLRANGEAVTA